MAGCPCERQVSLEIAGELAEPESRELGRHLDSCEGCRSLHADLRLIARAAAAEPELRLDSERLSEITRAVSSRVRAGRSKTHFGPLAETGSRAAGRPYRTRRPIFFFAHPGRARRNLAALSVAAAALVTVVVGYAIYASSAPHDGNEAAVIKGNDGNEAAVISGDDGDAAAVRTRPVSYGRAADSPEPERASRGDRRPAARLELPAPRGLSAFDSPAQAGVEPAADHGGGEATVIAGDVRRDVGHAPRFMPIVADVGPPAEPARDAVPAGTHLAYVDSKQGVVEVSRTGTGKWSAGVAAGVSLSPGDRLRTTNSRVRVRFERGSVLCVNRFTTLTLSGSADRTGDRTGVSMVGGEVYVETTPEDKGFRVETPHGRAVDLGTRFGVEVKRFETRVVVAEGRLEASTDAGRAELETGQEVLLARRTSPPGPVREARNLERRFAWARALDGEAASGADQRAVSPVALYAFGEGAGAIVRDVSGAGVPLNLHVEDEAAVEWLQGGGLVVKSPTALVSGGPAAKVVDACRAANSVTIETWLRPAYPGQARSARVVSLSGTRPHRNFSLGQYARKYEARLRTSASVSLEGEFAHFSTPPRAACARLSHVVFTRDAAGRACLYVDGVLAACETISGDFSNWDRGYRLILANETVRAGNAFDRPWLGAFYFLAIYDRAFTAEEVAARYRSGVPRPGNSIQQG